MALVGYESSDEEEEVAVPQPEQKSLNPTQDSTLTSNTKPSPSREPPAASSKADEQEQEQVAAAAAIIGPQIGPAPAAAAGPSFPPLEEAMEDSDSASPANPPGSPYTSTRALLRDLTLPPVPNTSIPPSPPGSPPAATSAKFERFLELKKQGVHFNSKVAANPSLRNPALADKLLAFVELAAADQYLTTLPPDVWDPAAFPREAYKEQLRLSQAEIEKARARGKGAPVEFVGAATATAGAVSGNVDGQAVAGTQAGSSQGSVPQQTTGKRRTRFDK